jgi:DnaJ-class molecular chaperone
VIKSSTSGQRKIESRESHKDCPDCLGAQTVYDGDLKDYKNCTTCDGTGWVYDDSLGLSDEEDYYGDEDHY